MNIAEHRLTISHQLEELSEDSLLEVEKLIAQLKSNQKRKQFNPKQFFAVSHLKNTESSVWIGIEQWREQAQFQEDDEILTDEMVASWREKSTGRDFSWSS
jgi:hypothetical protein